jgi:hypothetical protein
MAMLGLSGASFIIDPPPGDEAFGRGHSTLAISGGRNGVILYEHARDSYPAVLAASVPIAGWTHLVVNYENGRPAIYLDGKRVAVGRRSTAVVHAAKDMPVARPRLFEGDIAAFRMEPRSLSTDEIARLASTALPAPDGPPAVELATTEAGLLLWRNGSYTAGNRTIAARDIPPSSEIAGPWQVDFPPDLGAPASIALPTLVSLRHHQDFGVRHFSGTASYRTSFQIDRGTLGGRRRIFLDLGRVEVVAAVRVNGRELGNLWKPPFRLDITNAVRAGLNDLEVRVTNLWPNRLIGDEHFPPDYVYDVTAFDATGGIAELPEWYREGRPKPPGKRVAFTTWKHYDAHDPLLESGLLGPVRLFYAQLHPLS